MQAVIEQSQTSQRRACRLVNLSRSVGRYHAQKDKDGQIREKIIFHAHQRKRFGYRRIHILLKKEGMLVNHKKVYRLYQESGLKVLKRGGRKRALGSRVPMQALAKPDARWSLDFVTDALADGRRIRIESSTIFE